MDDELQELASLFGSLQEQESKMKLSEANCVELVNKLTRSGALQLIYTLDGSEYVTFEQLEKEIVEQVALQGRIELVKLHSVLNVDLDFVERAVKKLLDSGLGSMRLVDGELVSDAFLESVCLEIDEMLQLQSEVSLSQLADRFQFTNEFVQSLIVRNAGVTIHGVFEDEVLYTENFVRREQGKLRGALLAITVPTLLSKIFPVLPGMKRKLFFSCLDTLIARGGVPGSLTGKRGAANETYVPHAYAHLGERFVSSFFSSNGFVPLERAASVLGSEQSVSFLRRRFPDALFLPTCVVEQGTVEQLDAQVEEATAEAADATLLTIDLEPLLPACFSEEDTLQLLGKCKKVGPLKLIEARFLIGPRVEEEVRTRLRPLVEEAAAAFAKKLEVATAAAKEAKKIRLPLVKDCLTLDMCTKRLLSSGAKKWNPDLASALCERALDWLLQLTEEACAKNALASASAPQATQLSSDDKLEQAKSDFAQFWLNYSLFKSGLSLFEGESLTAAERHLVKTSGLSVVRCLVEIAALSNRIPLESCDVLVQKLPAKSALGPLWHAVSQGECSCAGFEALLSPACSPLKLAIAQPDAKTRRALMQAHRQVFLQQLEQQTAPAAVLHLAIVTLVAFRKEFIINVPPALLKEVLGALRDSVDANVLQVLGSDQPSAESIKTVCLANLKKNKK
jgi:hypothetical protein